MLNVCQVGVEIKFTVTKVYFHLFVMTKKLQVAFTMQTHQLQVNICIGEKKIRLNYQIYA